MTRSASGCPNIVQIVADDMGYGDFGCFSAGRTRTPAIDQLVSEGICLTQHYSASPVCNPSRATLLTGRYPHRTGSIDTLEWRGLERLALRETTLADVLRQAGYTTGHVGKWHLGAFDPRYHPLRRGFDEATCFLGGMHDYWDWRIEFGDTPKRADGRYMTDVWTEEACGFIERHADGPFFLQVMYNAPHTPLQCPAEEIRPFAETGRHTTAVSTIYGMIRRMDRGIERILQAIRDAGAETDTIVMFTSDNGPEFGGEGDQCKNRHNCGWRGSKGTTWEGGIRVPAVLRWPGVFEPEAGIHRMVHFADWYPTFLAAVGIEPPDGQLPLDGVNVLPVLRGEAGEVCPRRCWQWNRFQPDITQNAAIRDGDWKLVQPGIRHGQITPQDGKWHHQAMYEYDTFAESGVIREPLPVINPDERAEPQLFHIAEDPMEQNDLAQAEPDRLHRLRTDLETWFEDVEADRRSIDDEL